MVRSNMFSECGGGFVFVTRLWIVLFCFVIALNDLNAVKITRMAVPPIVEYGSGAVELECEWHVRGDSQGLVLKWFMEGAGRRRTLVYQWIAGSAGGQAAGPLRGKVEMTHSTLTSPHSLRLLRPDPTLSALYTCQVSTFSGEDEQTKRMIVFSPETQFLLSLNSSEFFKPHVRCAAKGAHPAPRLTLFMDDRVLEGGTQNQMMEDGRYVASVTAVLPPRPTSPPAQSTATFSPPKLIVCVLNIPEANYTTRKELLYYPDRVPMTDSPSASDIRLAAAVGSAGFRINSLVIVMLVIAACVVITFS